MPYKEPPRYRSDREEVDAFNAWSQVLGVPNKEEREQDMQIKATVVSQKTEEDFNPFLDTPPDMSNSTAIQPVPDDDIEVLPYRDVPLYLDKLAELSMAREDALAVLSIYESHVNCKAFDDFVNMDVPIHGAIIWDHPDTKSKSTGDFLPGWKEILLLSVDEQGNPFVIKASYGALAMHINGMLSARGWFLWDEPVKYRFARDPKTKAFQMYNLSRVKTLLAGRK